MLYYLSAAGLIAHTFFWGLGLAWIVTPRIWRRVSWAFAPALGWALQSAVVWAGAHTAVAGTDAYAWASELLPLGLLIFAFVRGRGTRPRGGIAFTAISVVAGWLLLSPLTVPGRGLTTSSLGSCDQADYFAGARVFQEFSKDDRTGFLGLPEVTKVRSADYFFDFWLRLNHFTPSALLAHNAAVFGVESYRLVSVTAVTLVLLNLPVLLLLTRALLGVHGWLAAASAAVYALSALNAYAVHHGALGQLYAAQGIAILTLAVIGADRAAAAGRQGWPFLPLVVAALWLLAGSYNFILVVCLAPAGGWLLGRLWWRRDVAALGRIIGLITVALGLNVILFWGRFSGLIERFSLFDQYNFGWVVPLTSPEGWLGILRDTGLRAWPAGIRAGLVVMFVGLYGWAVVRLWRRRPSRALAAIALVVPVVAGWGMLAWETRVRANASYDAYKILAVFYPGLLTGFFAWLGVVRRPIAAAILLAILVANLVTAFAFRREMSAPPLRVDRQLVAIGSLEHEPRIASLNMRVEDFWSRLWANAFLLRKPQYFQTHTYEGRLNTALKGEWDLQDTLLRTAPIAETDLIRVNGRFHAVRVAAPGRLRAGFAAGWHPLETNGNDRWRWCGGTGRLLVTNPSARPVVARLALRLRALRAGALELRLEQHVGGQAMLDGTVQDLVFADLLFQPGDTVVTLAGPAGAAPGGGDARVLSFALHDFELRSLAFEK